MKNKITQISTITSLSSGNYDGDNEIGSVIKYGNLGLGTVNGLDGELVILDSIAYQLKSDGSVNENINLLKTPFITVVDFEPSGIFDLSNLNLKQLENALMKKIGSIQKHFIYAFKIKTDLEYIKTRSVAKQNKPYKKLADVVDQQTIFEFKNQKGTIVGFYMPEEYSTIGVRGFHLHYISEDKKMGGHIFDFKGNNFIVEYSIIKDIEVKIGNNDFENDHDLQQLLNDIEIAEKNN